MQPVGQSREFRVETKAQAAAFNSQLRCRVLVACAHQEHSLSELQGRFDLPLPKLHYHVVCLRDAGLLTVSRIAPRAGRPIRYYKAIADSFLVPQSLLQGPPGANLAAQLREYLQGEYIRLGETACRYFPGPAGNLLMRLAPPETSGPPRAYELWRKIRLNPSQRAALAQELTAVIERYAALDPGKHGDPYLAHAAFAPRPEDDV